VDAALDALTGGLVLATGVLAWFTRELATQARLAWSEARDTRHEMERSRELSVRPLLAFDPHVAGGQIGLLLLRNVGRGPALEVTLRLRFWNEEVRDWSEQSVEPGESHQFKLPEPLLADMWQATKDQFTIRIEGRMTDLEGRVIGISDTVDLTAWTKAALGSGERVVGRRKIAGVEPE
jgi:hypothetical protein